MRLRQHKTLREALVAGPPARKEIPITGCRGDVLVAEVAPRDLVVVADLMIHPEQHLAIRGLVTEGHNRRSELDARPAVAHGLREDL